MKLSVVIVNYNVRYFLEQCLLSVRKAMEGIDAEVFVVDNRSVDGSVDMVASRFPWVRLIANTENTGFSKANNQAMRLAKGQYILLLNPDTVVQEDTFRKVIDFMDAHPQAGGLGVKMVDGKGNFLPESKRGLPTPEVAFYKIFGLSGLFPRSRRFGRYHLGHLDRDQTWEVDILSGAFMLLRKEALDKVGLLDESFFMYGEDIDLSWRIIQGGYRNYYFPGTRIIHYKGESTRKGSLNYVYVFYQAMVIFARKHFSERNARWFSFFIHLAIWMRAGLAILHRLARAAALPLADGLLTTAALWGAKAIYSSASHIPYDTGLVLPAFVACALAWMCCAFLDGAYDKPLRPLRPLRPLLVGSGIILVAYSLLPESLRFSRALLLMGMVIAPAVFILNRIVANVVTSGRSGLFSTRPMQIVLAGLPDEAERVRILIEQSGGPGSQFILVAPGPAVPPGYAGTLAQLDEIVRVHGADQVVFCARDLSSESIIGAMSNLPEHQLEFRIAPPETLFLVGSNSIEKPGDAFMLDINSISTARNRRLKRLLDIGLSLVILLLSPVLIWLVREPGGLLVNIWRVATGKWTWVGFCPQSGSPSGLPALRPGVLHPLIHLPSGLHTPAHISRLNLVYARDYRPIRDVALAFRAFRRLGRQPG